MTQQGLHGGPLDHLTFIFVKLSNVTTSFGLVLVIGIQDRHLSIFLVSSCVGIGKIYLQCRYYRTDISRPIFYKRNSKLF